MSKPDTSPVALPSTTSPFERLVMVTCEAKERRIVQRWLQGVKPVTFKRRSLWRCCLAVLNNTIDEITLVAALIGFNELSEQDLLGYLGKDVCEIVEKTSTHTWPSEGIAHRAKDLLETYREVAQKHLETLKEEYITLGGIPGENIPSITSKKTVAKVTPSLNQDEDFSLLTDMLHLVAQRVKKLRDHGTPRDRERFREAMDKSTGHAGSVFEIVRMLSGLCSETAHRRQQEER